MRSGYILKAVSWEYGKGSGCVCCYWSRLLCRIWDCTLGNLSTLLSRLSGKLSTRAYNPVFILSASSAHPSRLPKRMTAEGPGSRPRGSGYSCTRLRHGMFSLAATGGDGLAAGDPSPHLWILANGAALAGLLSRSLPGQSWPPYGMGACASGRMARAKAAIYCARRCRS